MWYIKRPNTPKLNNKLHQMSSTIFRKPPDQILVDELEIQ